MVALSNVALTDTFSVWLTRTNQLVVKTNEMENVSSNSYNKANAANSLANDSFTFANTVNIRVVAAFAQSNIALLSASAAHNKANAANYYAYNVESIAVSAYNQANSGTSAAAAFNKANSANYFAFLVDANTVAAFDKANAANVLANSSYTFANTVNIRTVASFSQANTANQAAHGAYALANTLNVTHQTLTDGATVNWDTNLGKVATLTVSSAGGLNRTVANPTNLRVETYILHVIQGDSTTRSITWGSAFKWTAQTAPPSSGGVGTRDVYSFVSDGTFMYGSFIPDVR